MSTYTHRLLAAASKQAIDGEITIRRWKHCCARREHGYWGRSGVELLWERPSSAKALLAKEAQFYIEVTTVELDDGTTVWSCGYETDLNGSRCEYVFRTPRPRAFYVSAIAASSERHSIAKSAPPAGSATKGLRL